MLMLMARYLVALAALALLSGCAGTPWLILGAASYHRDRDRGYEERHELLALEVPFGEDWRGVAGRFPNSRDRPSRFAAVMWLPEHRGRWHLGGLAGFVDGYDPADPSKLEFVTSPVIAYERRHWGVECYPFDLSVVTVLFKLRF